MLANCPSSGAKVVARIEHKKGTARRKDYAELCFANSLPARSDGANDKEGEGWKRQHAHPVSHLNVIAMDTKRFIFSISLSVLMQSREIFATYSLEEAKMELSISLPSNYPLGAIKIDSTKHIAGKLQAREIVKQLSIYLTHQNGRLYDGISLWKRNLDRKYEGVEECFVCYSVINQETCQLPRLTCKTCKKKFHSKFS